MADISQLVQEFKKIADAQSAIKSFEYGFPSDVNATTQRKYPALFLEKHPPFTVPEFSKKFRVYSLTFNVYDAYKQIQKKDKAPDAKISDLEEIAYDFVREFRKRSTADTAEVTTNKDWFVLDESVNVSAFENAHNDKVAGVEILMDVQLFTDCDEGTFTYDTTG